MEDNRTDGQINGSVSIGKQVHIFNTENKYSSTEEFITYGLTKKEYFAGLAMQSMLGLERDSSDSHIHDVIDRITTASVKAADMLLEKLEQAK